MLTIQLRLCTQVISSILWYSQIFNSQTPPKYKNIFKYLIFNCYPIVTSLSNFHTKYKNNAHFSNLKTKYILKDWKFYSKFSITHNLYIS